MPKTVKAPADAGYTDSLTLPRDGEGIDAGDVNAPMLALLGNDGYLYRTLAAQAQRIEELERLRGGFVLLTPAELTVEPARTYTLTDNVGIGRIDGYSPPVTLSALGLPVGVTATFDPNPATGNKSTLTVVVDPEAVAGDYNVTIRGVGGDGKINEALIKLRVTEATVQSSFSLYAPSPLPFTLDQQPGVATASSTQLILRSGLFGDPITLSVTGLPAGVTASFGSNPVTGSEYSEQVTVTLTSNGTGIPAGSYSPILRASGGNIVRTRPLDLRVTTPAGSGQPDFSLDIAYDTNSALTGNGATLSIARSSGMTGPITLNLPYEPNGPVLLINGQPWSAIVTSNTARITADGSSRGWVNSGVAPLADISPSQFYLLGLSRLTATAVINGVTVTRGIGVTYRQGTRSY